MSKLDEMRNQFREKMTVRSVPMNTKIHVIKVENDFNNPKSDSSFPTKESICSKNTTLYPKKTIPNVSTINEKKSLNDIRSAYNKPIVKPLNSNRISLKTDINKNSNRFQNSVNNRQKIDTKVNTLDKTPINRELKTKPVLNKSFERISKTPKTSSQSRLRITSSRVQPKTSFNESTGDGTPCRFCGRFFALSDRLQKHESVCDSSVDKSRQRFESVKQRFKGQPNEYLEKYEYALNYGSEEPIKKSNWRQKHEYCIAAIRAARGDTSTGPTTSQIMASIQQQCDYCKRKFNEDAIKRHLPICAKLFHKKIMNY